jgi:hypothetical protein
MAMPPQPRKMVPRDAKGIAHGNLGLTVTRSESFSIQIGGDRGKYWDPLKCLIGTAEAVCNGWSPSAKVSALGTILDWKSFCSVIEKIADGRILSKSLKNKQSE